MNPNGIGSLSPAKRILIFFGLGVVALFFPGIIDEIILALWGVAQLIGASKAARGVAEPKKEEEK